MSFSVSTSRWSVTFQFLQSELKSLSKFFAFDLALELSFSLGFRWKLPFSFKSWSQEALWFPVTSLELFPITMETRHGILLEEDTLHRAEMGRPSWSHLGEAAPTGADSTHMSVLNQN